MKKINKNPFCFLVFLFLFTTSSCDLPNTSAKNVFHTVTRIIDGDTFVIDDGTKKGKKIRLIGIDAPETRNTGKKLKSYFGEEAKHFLEKLLSGKEVMLEYDIQTQDRFGRTLAYAYLPDETFINAELIKHGYAQTATFPPNIKYVDLFLELQKEARDAERGLWTKNK